MPPPLPDHLKRITANPTRPARYRPGKAVPEEESSDEDEDEEVTAPSKPAPKPLPRTQPSKPARQVEEDDDDDDDEEGFVTDEEDDTPPTAANKASTSKSLTTRAQAPVQAVSTPARPSATPVPKDEESEEQSEDEEDEDEDESSEEEESSSEDEAPRRRLQRPTFIRKADRIRQSDGPKANNVAASAHIITEASSTPDLDEQTRRLAQADLYIKDKLERDAIARSQGRRAWDDDEELAPEDAVDDTDGLDPAAEHAAWKLRELRRLKRDREAIEAREKEIEELERRRNLTREERDAEDHERLERQVEERAEGRGTSTYLAKYHHKGAFFQDDEAAELLRKRDVMGAKFQDEVSDKSALPEYMRLRDMTKLGKKGRTRYTDLRTEDTSRLGEDTGGWKRKRDHDDDRFSGNGNKRMINSFR